MAPPLPPPGVPAWAGLAPVPIARLSKKRLFSTVQETPMLLRAPPLLHTLLSKRLSATYTGRLSYCERARMAPPPMSGPLGSQRLDENTALTMRSRPPRAKIAPPPPPSNRSPVEFPSSKARFWTTSSGEDWSWQCDVVHTCAGSQVSM